MKHVLYLYKVGIVGSEKLSYPKKPNYSYKARIWTQVFLSTGFILFSTNLSIIWTMNIIPEKYVISLLKVQNYLWSAKSYYWY